MGVNVTVTGASIDSKISYNIATTSRTRNYMMNFKKFRMIGTRDSDGYGFGQEVGNSSPGGRFPECRCLQKIP